LLRRHFIKHHPDELSYFEQGWNALPEEFKQGWSRSGLETRCSRSNDRATVPSKGFTSWTQYLFRIHLKRTQFEETANNIQFRDYPAPVLPVRGEDPNLYWHTGKILLETLAHEGILYGMPPAPDSQRYLDWSPRGLEDCGREDNAEQMKRMIGFAAIDVYLKNEKRKSLERLKERIAEEGLEAILSYFKENSVEWP
jgi:hypothetical protein